MAITLNGTTGITSPGGDSSAVDVTTPKVKNAGTLALEATGANVITFSNNGAESARMDSSGTLLMGTTSNFGSGSINVNTFKNGSARTALMTQPSTNINYDAVQFKNTTGTFVGFISCTSSTTAYVTSSDYRLKEDAKPVLNPIDRLMQLKPINFAWKVDGSRTDGFFAHEAQAVVPQAVTGEKDAVETVDVTDEEGKVIGTEVKPVHQGIDQSKLVPLLTAAIQEQQTLIQALTARIEALEVA